MIQVAPVVGGFVAFIESQKNKKNKKSWATAQTKSRSKAPCGETVNHLNCPEAVSCTEHKGASWGRPRVDPPQFVKSISMKWEGVTCLSLHALTSNTEVKQYKPHKNKKKVNPGKTWLAFPLCFLSTNTL